MLTMCQEAGLLWCRGCSLSESCDRVGSQSRPFEVTPTAAVVAQLVLNLKVDFAEYAYKKNQGGAQARRAAGPASRSATGGPAPASRRVFSS